MGVDASYNLKGDLFLADTLEDRIHIAATALRDHFSTHGLDVKLNKVKTLTRLYLQRCDMALLFHQEPKLVGETLLIKASESAASKQLTSLGEDEDGIPDDLWLHEIVTGSCHVEIMEGRHDTFLSRNVNEISKLIDSVLCKFG